MLRDVLRRSLRTPQHDSGEYSLSMTVIKGAQHDNKSRSIKIIYAKNSNTHPKYSTN